MRSHKTGRTEQNARTGRAPATQPTPARAGVGGLASEIRSLQLRVGNRAAVRILDEARHGHGAGRGHEQVTPPSVQRSAVDAVLGAQGHAVPVQRAVRHESKELTLAEAREQVLQAQSAELTPSEMEALRALVEDTTQHHDVDSGEQLVRLLRSQLRDKWGLTSEQVDLLDRYQGGDYKAWNEALRSGKVTERYKVANDTSAMIKALAQTAKTKQKVKRTLSFETREQFNAYARQFEEGKEYTAVQFESTTRQLGATLHLPEKAVYVITVLIDAQGHHGGEISSVISPVRKSEGETTFPPGAKFKITRAPEQPPEDREFSTTAPFQTIAEMTELEELDASKQRMPTREEYRAATMTALLGGSGLPSRPPAGAGRARKGSF
ncbi:MULTISPECIES: ADP-ribosyltransferase [unclassified Streptomyces]|uniref:ADP-ribosyltransferase n=1 Tax=unclassified Streptomyces TaxID=2593676 RepID=UPI000F6CD9DB|nr:MULTISPECIES: ADP-ribosyltransferase [unclassified Streptomyces]AZM62540.1 hypothetical protein DLM49_26085 [Streptomyces sp. WAC 01438]RSM92486.1 hypothetical protein DMA10_24275 [Streptomyces sp. WAC 01420]